jgi:hypothetical protein
MGMKGTFFFIILFIVSISAKIYEDIQIVDIQRTIDAKYQAIKETSLISFTNTGKETQDFIYLEFEQNILDNLSLLKVTEGGKENKLQKEGFFLL